MVLLIAGGLFMFTYKSTQFNVEGFALVLGASFIGGIRWTLTQMLLQKAELGECLLPPQGGDLVLARLRPHRPRLMVPVSAPRPPKPHRHHVPPAAAHVSGPLSSLCRV